MSGGIDAVEVPPLVSILVHPSVAAGSSVDGGPSASTGKAPQFDARHSLTKRQSSALQLRPMLPSLVSTTTQPPRLTLSIREAEDW